MHQRYREAMKSAVTMASRGQVSDAIELLSREVDLAAAESDEEAILQLCSQLSIHDNLVSGPSGALKWARRALESRPDSPQFLYVLADALWRLDRQGEAIETATRARGSASAQADEDVLELLDTHPIFKDARPPT